MQMHLRSILGTSAQHLYSRKVYDTASVFTHELLSNVLSNGEHFLMRWDFT